jgi:hypothetical protein
VCLAVMAIICSLQILFSRHASIFFFLETYPADFGRL